MKRHLNLHFKRIIIKNPKLNKNDDRFMTFLFLKGFFRSLKIGLDLIYIDEKA